jgi:hypothetical protein
MTVHGANVGTWMESFVPTSYNYWSSTGGGVMERPVEVSLFERGELRSVTTFAPANERRAAVVAGSVATSLVLTAMLLATAFLGWLDLVVHGPTFFASWFGVAAFAGWFSYRRTRRRARRFRLGADIEADAFAMIDVDLIRRARSDYEIGLVAGMSGILQSGRSTLPIEALTGRTVVRVPVPREGKVHIDFGLASFVIRRLAAAGQKERVGHTGLHGWNRSSMRRVVETAAAAIPVAALATLLASIPAGTAVAEGNLWPLVIIPYNTPPLETVRLGAQAQASAFHQCFDPLPLSCQRSGRVDVVLALSKSGDVRSHWISSSTFGTECPVAECMERVVSRWVFHSLPDAMTLVLPGDVQRTGRSLVPRDESTIPGVRVEGGAWDAGYDFVEGPSR